MRVHDKDNLFKEKGVEGRTVKITSSIETERKIVNYGIIIDSDYFNNAFPDSFTSRIDEALKEGLYLYGDTKMLMDGNKLVLSQAMVKYEE